MPWNPPAAFTTDELVTATKLTQISDSLAYLCPGCGTPSVSRAGRSTLRRRAS
jgi:hypothetical protein